MFKKGTKIYSIAHNKCPRCQEGDFFKYKNPYNFGKFDKMDPKCSVCGEDFVREPGFYYGAMYVSYALNVAIFVSMWVAIEVLRQSEVSTATYLTFIILPVLLLMPVTFRTARLIWTNFFVNYDKQKGKSLTPITIK